MGTWIEIATKLNTSKQSMVVPYVGTWIEIELPVIEMHSDTGRSLRGNVDRNIVGELNEALGTESFPTWERG